MSNEKTPLSLRRTARACSVVQLPNESDMAHALYHCAIFGVFTIRFFKPDFNADAFMQEWIKLGRHPDSVIFVMYPKIAKKPEDRGFWEIQID